MSNLKETTKALQLRIGQKTDLATIDEFARHVRGQRQWAIEELRKVQQGTVQPSEAITPEQAGLCADHLERLFIESLEKDDS